MERHCLLLLGLLLFCAFSKVKINMPWYLMEFFCLSLFFIWMKILKVSAAWGSRQLSLQLVADTAVFVTLRICAEDTNQQRRREVSRLTGCLVPVSLYWHLAETRDWDYSDIRQLFPLQVKYKCIFTAVRWRCQPAHYSSFPSYGLSLLPSSHRLCSHF